MSPIGSPDFGANPATNPTAPSFDSGEDTTRLLMGGGSQARSGRWIFATGFEEGATPYIQYTANGTGGETKIVNNIVYQGLGALQLKAGNAVNNEAWIQKTFMYPSSRYGLEFLFSRQYSLSSELNITLMGGGKGAEKDKFRVGKIVIVINTGGSPAVGIYQDVNGNRTLIFDASNYINGSSYLWHYIKIVFDFENNKISRLYFDDLLFNLNSSGYEFSNSTVSTVAEIKLINKYAAVNPYYYIDNLIITADEP